MAVDVADLLRELDVQVSPGSSEATWFVRLPDRTAFEARVLSPVAHVSAHVVRSLLGGDRSSTWPLFIGETATDGVIERAVRGEFDLLTQTSFRLIHGGLALKASPPLEPITPAPQRGRPAWVRWALQRFLLLTRTPTRQPDIATTLGSSQQAISQAARALGDLVVDDGQRLIASHRHRLLEHWLGEYPGPGGQRFGWYALDPVTELAEHVVDVAGLLEVPTLVSGDVAADRKRLAALVQTHVSRR